MKAPEPLTRTDTIVDKLGNPCVGAITLISGQPSNSASATHTAPSSCSQRLYAWKPRSRQPFCSTLPWNRRCSQTLSPNPFSKLETTEKVCGGSPPSASTPQREPKPFSNNWKPEPLWRATANSCAPRPRTHLCASADPLTSSDSDSAS